MACGCDKLNKDQRVGSKGEQQRWLCRWVGVVQDTRSSVGGGGREVVVSEGEGKRDI